MVVYLLYGILLTGKTRKENLNQIINKLQDAEWRRILQTCVFKSNISYYNLEVRKLSAIIQEVVK